MMANHKYTALFSRLLGGILCLVLISNVYGQKNCINKTCTQTVNVDGKKYSFDYKIKIYNNNGTTGYKKGRYVIKSENLDDVSGELIIENIDDDLILFFSRDKKPSNAFISIKYACFKKTNKNASNPLRFHFNKDGNPAIGDLHFGAVTGNISDFKCREIQFNKWIALSFIYEDKNKKVEEPVKEEPIPAVDNTKAEPTKIDEAVSDLQKSSNIQPNRPNADNEPLIQDNPQYTDVNQHTDISTDENLVEKPTVKPRQPTKSTSPSNPGKKKEDKYEREIEAATGDIDKLGALEAIIKKEIPDSRLLKSIRDSIRFYSRIEEEYPHKKISDSYRITIKNALDLVIDTAINVVAELIPEGDTSYILEVVDTTDKEGIVKEVHLFDKIKPDSINTATVIPGGIELEIKYNEDNTKIISITFKKGTPPYVGFIKVNGKSVKIKSIDGDLWQIPDEIWGELYGNIEVLVSHNNDNSRIHVWSHNREKSDILLLWMLGIAGFLFLSVVIYPFLKRQRRKNKAAARMKERKEKLMASKEKKDANREELKATPKESIEEGGNYYEGQKRENTAGKQAIKITGIRKSSARAKQFHDEKILNKLIKTELTYEFDTTVLWENTMISSVIFTDKGVTQLDNFLQKENLKPLKEQDGQIPEIGGILLGKPFLSKATAMYRVLVEAFVPIEAAYSDVYQLEFSAHSLAKDLGNIQDQYPELMLIGWFHTHPGHGLFLSRPDLRIHDSFFRESFQFAMEIDSLTDRLDTAFFTRMNNGKVNNRKNLKPNTPWYSWEDININY